MLTKKECIEYMYKNSDWTKKDCNKAFDMMADLMRYCIINYGGINIPKVLTLSTRVRKGRKFVLNGVKGVSGKHHVVVVSNIADSMKEELSVLDSYKFGGKP